MSGGKGGSTTQTSKVEIPDYLEEPIKRNIAKAEDLATIGFTPYMGPTVAAMTPMQQAAMQNTSSAAQAYGLGAAPGQEVMPQPQTFAGGVQGYSSFPIYEQALAELQSRMPGQYQALQAPFRDPVTGTAPEAPYGQEPAPEPAASSQPTSRPRDNYSRHGIGPGGRYNPKYDRAP